jgi:hypothetical protein
VILVLFIFPPVILLFSKSVNDFLEFQGRKGN